MRILKKLLFVTIILTMVLWGLKFISPNLRIEGYTGLILEYFFLAHDTVFADNYSCEGFLAIKKGMTEKEVVGILGEPLKRWAPKDNYVGLQYMESQESTHYRLRQVYLTKGKVIEINEYYYFD